AANSSVAARTLHRGWQLNHNAAAPRHAMLVSEHLNSVLHLRSAPHRYSGNGGQNTHTNLHSASPMFSNPCGTPAGAWTTSCGPQTYSSSPTVNLTLPSIMYIVSLWSRCTCGPWLPPPGCVTLSPMANPVTPADGRVMTGREALPPDLRFGCTSMAL